MQGGHLDSLVEAAHERELKVGKMKRVQQCIATLLLLSTFALTPTHSPCNALQCASTAESKLQLATLPLLGAVQEIFPVGLQLMWGIFLEIADGRSGCLKG